MDSQENFYSSKLLGNERHRSGCVDVAWMTNAMRKAVGTWEFPNLSLLTAADLARNTLQAGTWHAYVYIGIPLCITALALLLVLLLVHIEARNNKI